MGENGEGKGEAPPTLPPAAAELQMALQMALAEPGDERTGVPGAPRDVGRAQLWGHRGPRQVGRGAQSQRGGHV